MSKNRAHLTSMLQALFSRYRRGNSTDAEKDFVEQLYEQVPNTPINEADATRIGEEIKNNIQKRIQQDKIVRLRRIVIPAAACLLLLFGFLLKYGYDQAQLLYEGQRHAQVTGKTGASVSVGDKRYDNLQDSIPAGSYFQISGQDTLLNLAHMPVAAGNELVTIANTAKQLFSLLLPDGTTVDLYPAAQISFRSAFQPADRYVSVSGKVFFDVKTHWIQGEKAPFRVETALQTIDVLGTEFTVDAELAGEESLSLKEGSVKLTHRGSEKQVLLKPGEQAFLAAGKPSIFVTTDNDAEKIAAWRKELFYFDEQPLSAVMEELSNWYGITIRVDNKVSKIRITGTFSRYPDITSTLDIIEMTNNISYYEKKGVFYVNKK